MTRKQRKKSYGKELGYGPLWWAYVTFENGKRVVNVKQTHGNVKVARGIYDAKGPFRERSSAETAAKKLEYEKNPKRGASKKAARAKKTKLKKLSKEYKKTMAMAKKFSNLYNKFHAKGEKRKAASYQRKETRCFKKCRKISSKIQKLKK
jgi:hypothetical protein